MKAFMTIFLTAFTIVTGCDNASMPIGEAQIVDSGHGRFAVAVFDEGVKLSTYHLRLEIRNVTANELLVSYEMHIDSKEGDKTIMTVAFHDYDTPQRSVEQRGISNKSKSARPKTTQLRLLPDQIYNIFVNTGSPEKLRREDIRILWKS